jgi:hypothetical protein
MNNHDVPEYFADDETVFDFFGAGADHQAVQVGSFTDQGRSGIPEVRQTFGVDLLVILLTASG